MLEVIEKVQMAATARVNGMRENDPNGSYIQITVSEKSGAITRYYLSVGAAEVLAGEILGLTFEAAENLTVQTVLRAAGKL